MGIDFGPLSNLDLSNKKILIVDDDRSSRALVSSLLRKTGLAVITASQGDIAVSICQSDHNIDAVLMDLKMPKMNGYNATKCIKESFPNLPIIAYTAYAMNGDKERAIQAGCDDYLTKPLLKKELFRVLGRYLS